MIHRAVYAGSDFRDHPASYICSKQVSAAVTGQNIIRRIFFSCGNACDPVSHLHGVQQSSVCRIQDLKLPVGPEHSPVFRVGGDEFVAILTGRDFAVREELMKTLARRSEENIALQEVVVAGGCADFDPASDTTLRSVFERADSRMYEEKQRLKSLGARTRQEEKKR